VPTWKNSDGTPVTDPAVLAQLNGNVAGPSVSPFIPAAGASVADASTAPTKQWRGPDGKPVTDPAVLAQLSLGTPAAPALPAAPVDPNALGPDEQRGELAPVIRNTKTGALRLAWPQMALDIGSALTLPGDVASGKTPLDPRVPFSQQDPATLDRAGQLATLVGTGPSLASSGMADALTSPGATAAAQKAATNAAIADAPTSSGLESAASQVFKSSVDTNPLMISDTAYMRFMGDVQDALKKYRPNPNNDPQTVGLLSHLTDLADQANTPGTVVDFKDLHLARQLANQVGQSPGRDGAMGRTVVNQLDSFIKGLSADDILGGTDPFKSANDLANGISTWDRATKVGLIEDATTKADTYPSGMTNGLKITFSQLMRTPDFARFSPVEQQAIRSVAKGTPGQNTLSLLGKLGFSPGGTGAHNILGGALGTALSTAALTPVIGAGPAMVAGPAANMMVSAGARKAAEGLALKNAGRAARIAATPNIPTVAPQAISPALTSASKLAEQLDLIRASETNSGGSGGGGGF
jgi:hypothetical protein